MNGLIKTIDTIGYYGPEILFFSTIFILWNQLPYVIAFVPAFYLNLKFNEVLKHTIREPRPKQTNLRFEYEPDPTGTHVWGMPSGHAQLTFFSISYLFFVTKSMQVLAFSALLGFNTLFQRYKSNMHTGKQLGVGAVIGTLAAYLTYAATKYWKTQQWPNIHF